MEHRFMGIGRTLLVGIVGVALTLPACTATPEVVEEPPPVEEPAKEPAEFEVGDISIEPATVMVGDSPTVAASVRNVGDVAGTYTAVLRVDGEKRNTKEIRVAGRSSEQVSFDIAKPPAGDYLVAIAESTSPLTVWRWSPYTIKYDEGVTSLGAIFVKGDYGHITRFTPPTTPFKIQQVSICGWAHPADADWFETRHVTITIWNSDSSKQLWSQDYPWSLFVMQFAWAEVEVPDLLVDGDFYVEIVTHSDPIHRGGYTGTENIVGIAFDKPGGPKPGISSPQDIAETRSGYSYMGKRVKAQGRFERINWCIRVSGEGKAK